MKVYKWICTVCGSNDEPCVVENPAIAEKPGRCPFKVGIPDWKNPADLPEAGASAERISSVVRSNATTGWISVQERLPEIKAPVLMRVTCGSRFNVEEGQYKGGSEWVNCWCSIRNENLYPVTHWMPLPDAPEV